MFYSESTDAKNVSAINESKKLIKKAKIEHSKKFPALVEEQLEKEGITDVPPRLVSLARERSLERIDEVIETETDKISKNPSLTLAELRELRGEINIPRTKEKLEFLEKTERVHWKELYEAEIAKEREARAAGHEEKAKQHHQKALLYEAIVDRD